MVTREELLRKGINVSDFGIWRRRFEIEVLNVVTGSLPFWLRYIFRAAIGSS